MADAYTALIKKEMSPKIEALRDDLARRKDTDFFWPSGTQVYCGQQGSGKTTAAVYHATIKLKGAYPKAKLVSNLVLSEFEPVTLQGTDDEIKAIIAGLDTRTQYIFFQTALELQKALTMVSNGFKGVIYLIDEIHTYFNSLDSSGMPPWIFTEIAQQRKQRKVIIGTSQLFLRMAKPFREQCSSLIICRTFFGFFTKTTSYDGMSLTQDYDGSLHGNVKKSGWFFHTRRIRAAFDTFQKINTSGGILEFEQIQAPTVLANQKGRKIKIR